MLVWVREMPRDCNTALGFHFWSFLRHRHVWIPVGYYLPYLRESLLLWQRHSWKYKGYQSISCWELKGRLRSSQWILCSILVRQRTASPEMSTMPNEGDVLSISKFISWGNPTWQGKRASPVLAGLQVQGSLTTLCVLELVTALVTYVDFAKMNMHYVFIGWA